MAGDIFNSVGKGVKNLKFPFAPNYISHLTSFQPVKNLKVSKLTFIIFVKS